MPEKALGSYSAVRFKNRLRFALTVSVVVSFFVYPVFIVVAFKYGGAGIAAAVALALAADIGVCVFFLGRYPDVEVSPHNLEVWRYLTIKHISWDRVREVDVPEAPSADNCEPRRYISIKYLAGDRAEASERINLSGFSGADRARLKDLVRGFTPGERYYGADPFTS